MDCSGVYWSASACFRDLGQNICKLSGLYVRKTSRYSAKKANFGFWGAESKKGGRKLQRGCFFCYSISRHLRTRNFALKHFTSLGIMRCAPEQFLLQKHLSLHSLFSQFLFRSSSFALLSKNSPRKFNEPESPRRPRIFFPSRPLSFPLVVSSISLFSVLGGKRSSLWKKGKISLKIEWMETKMGIAI